MKRNIFSTVIIATAILSAASTVAAKDWKVEPVYDAKSVTVKHHYNDDGVTYWWLTEYRLIGVAKDGCQVWTAEFTEDNSVTMNADWSIDKGPILGTVVYKFKDSTVYDLVSDYSWPWYLASGGRSFVDILSNKQVEFVHYFKPSSQTTAKYFVWNSTHPIYLSDWRIEDHLTFEPTKPIYDAENFCYRIPLSWKLSNLTTEGVKKITLKVRYKDVDTPQLIEITGKVSGQNEIVVPWTVKNVTITADIELNERYAFAGLTNGSVVSDRLIFDLTPEVDCTIKASNLRENFRESDHTYAANVEWTCTKGYEHVFDNVTIDYSTDNGKSWKVGYTDNSGSGTHLLQTILPGYSKYIFRCRIVAHNVKGEELINSVATDTIEINYDPKVTRLEIEGNLTDGYDEAANTFKPTIAYEINRDLYEVSNLTSLECSINGGAFKEATKFFPDEKGTITVPIDANCKTCQFRLNVSALSEGKWVNYEGYSPVYQRFMGVDEVTTDDNTPVDVYTLDGKLIAKQMLPSAINDRLAAGTYIISGKKVTVKK